MHPQGANGRAGKTWPDSLRSDFSLVWGSPGSQLCDGCFWELSGSVSGTFRSSEIGSRGAFGAPKSVLRAFCASISLACSISKLVVGSAEHTRWLRTQSLTKHAPLCREMRLTLTFFSRVGACGLWPGNPPTLSSVWGGGEKQEEIVGVV